MSEVKTKETKSKIKRVGVLRGGAGKHYASSLKKGGEIIFYISEKLGDKYKPIDILIDKNNIWHCAGVPIDPDDLADKVDVIWNVAHPTMSDILNRLSIPNIDTSTFSFTLENNKEILRERIKDIKSIKDIGIPRSILFPKNAREVLEKFGSPWIVKNYNEIRLVKTFDELREVINGSTDLMVEEFITGKVASVHSVPLFRGEEIYTFPLGNAFGSFSAEEKEKLATLAKDLCKHLGIRHYLKIDFVLNPRGKVYVLDIESNPNLKEESHFYQVCESVGTEPHYIIEHVLEQALNTKA